MSENNKEKSVIRENLIKLRDYFEIKKKLRDQIYYFINELRKINYFEEEKPYLDNGIDIISIWPVHDLDRYLEGNFSGPEPQILIKFKTYYNSYLEPKTVDFKVSAVVLASEENINNYIQSAKEGVRKKLLAQEPDYKRYLELKKRYGELD